MNSRKAKSIKRYANLEPSLPNHFLKVVGRKVQSIGSEDK